MPELPEVEAMKRVLQPQIQGHKIENIIVKQPAVIGYPDSERFCNGLIQNVIASMDRRGKYLIIKMKNNNKIIIHLKMTGRLLLVHSDLPEIKHTHLIFQLDNGQELRYIDTRRFGRLWFIKNGEADSYSGIEQLGKEPFDPSFLPEYLNQQLSRRKKAIKECLLDQRIIAGIGNIYSDEILFKAKIHPARQANTLTSQEYQRLATIIPEQLTYFIEKNKMTPEQYLRSNGQDYRNTPFLQVYGKKGKACPVCGQTLCRVVIGGRGSIFCPNCQKENG
ncbi:DNA-formamidopyrimidine glycosylase [Thomasclavelia sp.]|uniref:DNA-formamidopyrimidine glycosylase n=1 Tax=Thomasclavelia sp. TaxID=3025757 RepID=UPI0025CF85FB|nr:DNA-formamidopyrimidine glycosylase [Thomasclavelia sp.]